MPKSKCQRFMTFIPVVQSLGLWFYSSCHSKIQHDPLCHSLKTYTTPTADNIEVSHNNFSILFRSHSKILFNQSKAQIYFKHSSQEVILVKIMPLQLLQTDTIYSKFTTLQVHSFMYISIKQTNKQKADKEMQLQKHNPAFLQITFPEIHLDICKTKGYSNILQKWYSDISKGQMKNLLSTHEVLLFVFKSYNTGTYLHLFIIVYCLSNSSYSKRTKK